jgi:hypothetical protein
MDSITPERAFDLVNQLLSGSVLYIQRLSVWAKVPNADREPVEGFVAICGSIDYLVVREAKIEWGELSEYAPQPTLATV